MRVRGVMRIVCRSFTTTPSVERNPSHLCLAPLSEPRRTITICVRSRKREMPRARALVSLLTDQQEFQRLQAAEATATAALHDIEAEVVFAENNGVVQIQQLFKAIHAPAGERPAAIIVE